LLIPPRLLTRARRRAVEQGIAAALTDAAENRHVEVIILEDHRQAQLS
jgi:hypothetical protein